MLNLNKILIPTDFSEHSDKALVYATEMAKLSGAELHLIHAFESVPIAYGEAGYIPIETTDKIKAEVSKQLDDVPVETSDAIQVHRSVVTGHPFVEIVRYAKENSIDLIVMGTHGRGAIAHMLLGSVAEKVVQKAPCPVLVVRDQEHDFVMP